MGMVTDRGGATAATWPWFTPMHEATGGRPSIVPPVLMDSWSGENQALVNDVAPEESGPILSTSVVATCRPASGEDDDEEEVPAEPGTNVTQDGEPSTSACPQPPKRRRNKLLQQAGGGG
eukprot:superscaffoldBa00001571_g11140